MPVRRRGSWLVGWAWSILCRAGDHLTLHLYQQHVRRGGPDVFADVRLASRIHHIPALERAPPPNKGGRTCPRDRARNSRAPPPNGRAKVDSKQRRSESEFNPQATPRI